MRLIDADALKKDMCSTCDNRERCEDRETVCSEIADIDEQPTIEAEPVKHGRWIDKPYERWKAYDVRYCSKCNWSIHKNHLRKTDLNWNFCPNCGARMDLMDGDGA